ncbi:hypothetical protein RW115_01235 [Macrococcus capreoli]
MRTRRHRAIIKASRCNKSKKNENSKVNDISSDLPDIVYEKLPDFISSAQILFSEVSSLVLKTMSKIWVNQNKND